MSTAPTQAQLRADAGPEAMNEDVNPGIDPPVGLGARAAEALLVGQLPTRLRLGTRRSTLARTQSQWVADRLTEALASVGREVGVELVDVITAGDVSARENTPLVSLAGTGVFVSALRDALLEGRIDLAVHSLKDLPTAPADGLVTAAIPVREDSRDVLVARDGLSLAELPAGARIGTGSPRRAAQLRALGLGVDVVGIRGNVDTRIRLVTDGVVDGVVLARAGLRRLERQDEATEVFDPLLMLPAAGQGALAVECRADDVPLQVALGLLDDPATRVSVAAERALLAALEAGCSAPVGALAEVVEGDGDPYAFELTLRAVVASVDGAVSFRRSDSSPLAGRYDPPEPDTAVPKPTTGTAGAVTTQTVTTQTVTTHVVVADATAADVAAAVELGRRLAAAMLDEGAAELMSTDPAVPPHSPPDLPTTTAALARKGDS